MAHRFGSADRNLLRGMADRIRNASERPIEQVKKDLWYRHNALEPTRPLVVCDPENAWDEIIPEESLFCCDPDARSIENELRQRLFQAESLRDDTVCEGVLRLKPTYTETGYGLPMEISGGNDGGAYALLPALERYDQLDILRSSRIVIDEARTEQRLEMAAEAVGDLLEVRIQGRWWWSLGLTQEAIRLIGYERFLMDLLDDSENVHRLMSFLRDATMQRLDDLESRGLLSLNNDGTWIGSGGFGWTRELPSSDPPSERVRLRDLWGFAESQETVVCSPEMFTEFVLPYQLPILARFGLNSYGCCEPLERRWEEVARIPRLRRVSVSPWSDPNAMAERLRADYIMSCKANPVPLSAARPDFDSVAKSLEKLVADTRGCIVEIIMKDTHTIGREPENLITWCRMAHEAAERG